MTKHLPIIFLFWLIFPTGNSLNAQFIDVNLRLEPQILAAVERPIRFGTVVSGSGLRRIGLGEQDMGIFAVEGLAGQEILVQISTSDELRSDPNDENAPSIPLDLTIRNGSDIENPFDSELININAPVIIRMEAQDEEFTFARSYFYVFGSINVGFIPAGSYTGSVVLNVSYQ